MKLMPCRLVHLTQMFEAYKRLQVPLIRFDGQSYHSFSAADDLGIYLVIPKLAYWFNTSIETMVNMFFYSVLMVAAIVGTTALCKTFSNYLSKFVAFLAIVGLTFITKKIGDTYIMYTAACISIMPWAIYFYKKQHYETQFFIYVCAAGAAITFFHSMRAHAGTASLLFMALLFGVDTALSIPKKLRACFFFAIGMLLPLSFFAYEYKKYNDYLSVSHTMEKYDSSVAHPFWHSVYIGLGFLWVKNPDNIIYSDSCAAKKVESINPNVSCNSSTYEQILKHEVFNIIKKYPVFFLYTIFAKIGILLLFFLLFANLGIVAAYFCPKPFVLNLAFLGAFGFSSLFPLLVLPLIEYSLGFITCSTLYGIVSIGYLLEKESLSFFPYFLNMRLLPKKV